MDPDDRFSQSTPVGQQVEGITERRPDGPGSFRVEDLLKKRGLFELSPRYGPAVRVCLGLQILLPVLVGTTLGLPSEVSWLVLFAVVGQWIGNIIIAVRRPLSPTKGDLFFISWGLVPLFLIAPLLADLVWAIIGPSGQNGLQRLLALLSG